MKCPYCGCESRKQVCENCKALIPEEHKEPETKQQKQAEPEGFRKRKRSE